MTRAKKSGARIKKASCRVCNIHLLTVGNMKLPKATVVESPMKLKDMKIDSTLFG